MIIPFKEKMRRKQEAYEAEQKVLAEQAEQVRIEEEWKAFDKEQEIIAEKDRQFLLEDQERKAQEYLEWKTEFRLQQLREQEQVESKPIDTGLPMNHDGTWQLTWKAFSTHPDIINKPMSEKIRLYKIAERQQVDRLNYYANLHVDHWRGATHGKGLPYWDDGVVDEGDGITVITQDTVWDNSVDVNVNISVNPGITLTVNGILTANSVIANYGNIIINGLLVKAENITTFDDGTITIND